MNTSKVIIFFFFCQQWTIYNIGNLMVWQWRESERSDYLLIQQTHKWVCSTAGRGRSSRYWQWACNSFHSFFFILFWWNYSLWHSVWNEAENPNVVSVFLSKKHKLHTTRSWEFLGLHRSGKNSAWQEGSFGENTIIANIDTGKLNYLLIMCMGIMKCFL